MAEENVTKKQHYVPELYLKRFANSREEVHTLNAKEWKVLPSRSYKGVGYGHFFYAAETGVADKVSQEVEQWLQKIETIIAKTLPGIIEKILGDKHLDNDDRYTLSALMSMLWLRSPGMREQINQMSEEMTKKIMSFYAPQRVDKFQKETGTELTPEAREQLIKAMEDGSYEVKFSNAQHLKFMLETMGYGGPGYTNMFYGQKWKIYVAKGKRRFITSDSPVVEWWPPPKTFFGGNSFLERAKYFPLTPEIFFELTYPIGSEKMKRKTIFENEDDIVTTFNMLTASRCHQFVYSGEKEILEEFLAKREKPGPVEVAYFERFERPWIEAKKQGEMQ